MSYSDELIVQRQIEIGREQMPQQPLDDSGSEQAKAYEVVLAKNIYPPFRFAQDYFWLEVIAADHFAAVNSAARWVAENDVDFECTDLVREYSEHLATLGHSKEGKPLTVSWSLPIDHQWQAGTQIRNPITGIRIGFIATSKTEAKYLPAEHQGQYRLLVRKPVDYAQPVCWGPLVHSASPLRSD